MQNNKCFINEILTEIYQDEQLQRCMQKEIRIHPERIRILHKIVMNYDQMTKAEIRELAFGYAKSIRKEDLLARQIFLCILHLIEV